MQSRINFLKNNTFRRLTSEWKSGASMEARLKRIFAGVSLGIYYFEMPKFEIIVYNDDTAFHLERLNLQLARLCHLIR